jgi:hypothetical protein
MMNPLVSDGIAHKERTRQTAGSDVDKIIGHSGWSWGRKTSGAILAECHAQSSGNNFIIEG